ncbi:MAG: hypothetical protein GF401_16825 [Chitinivibrionales bacterium]|nr:hypothetical protein [Chitinivibrionales bacterium]
MRNILHINIVNFYTAVARALNPRLESWPVAVVSAGATRRVVLDFSSEAREAGLYRGMLLDEARRRCPDLRILNPTPSIYDRAYAALTGEASRLSPQVETAGPGHLFVDLTGTRRLFGGAVDVGYRLKQTIENKYRLPCTAGLAGSKLVSKVATRVIKPVGLCSVVHGCEDEFMAPLPITFLPGIDHKVIRQLIQFNLNIISDLHVLQPRELSKALGDIASTVQRLSHGIDSTPVRKLKDPAPSLQEQASLKQQSNDLEYIKSELFNLVVRAGVRLRQQGIATRKIVLVITYKDNSRSRRTTSLHTPINGDLSIFDCCRTMLNLSYKRRICLTEMSIQLQQLSSPYGQLDLFVDNEQENQLMNALDKIRGKFGINSVKFYGKQIGMME